MELDSLKSGALLYNTKSNGVYRVINTNPLEVVILYHPKTDTIGGTRVPTDKYKEHFVVLNEVQEEQKFLLFYSYELRDNRGKVLASGDGILSVTTDNWVVMHEKVREYITDSFKGKLQDFTLCLLAFNPLPKL